MGKSVISATPWHIDKEQGPNQWAIVGANTAIAFIPASHKYAEANASAIVLAVNETFGENINPAAVSDMKSALLMAREELCFGGDWKTAIKIIDGALAKAKATPNL